ncbi:adenylate/guanylate cyclase domain-containing protein [Sinorhizobium meliloti]|uniref:adenylate/guanylate cyclase domain-containing protein n=1 Tax=Rhizobium meliloti TaxID=382 RepID=UPI001296C96D|nr:adenylate/guanylate cyclase domain-containing protein [Sinorhizobium meliloti]MDW9378502.1 adenylate/guanylate cyclase domain-containing protein [Sinorhizobium meliloti]MDW9496833.1 adenylate/guanylate cyclase domain-containing protein [Sinorhizobium meliloti]MDW9545034.1 adenylate/guanylate cyclase domain-containing protein [Sinorhizobium meliloti]MDW9565450.1 adenylate/guanylate cyclase domain-containing protein [Sinorhizobium meliloti]MDW9652836.1 adenylate/guanylate cyclase domain-conta
MMSSLSAHWDSAREVRSILLRFVAFAILVANLLLGGNEGAIRTHAIVVVGYFVISLASVATARFMPDRLWLNTLFVVLDALLVALLLYAHILAGPVTENHNLTTSSLVVAFILLNHVGLKLDRRLVLVFSGIVVVSWVTMLAITAARHHTADIVSLFGAFFNQDLGLTVSFGFTAFAIYLLSRDHDRTRKEALKADRRRLNLSRFFSPLVVADLQEASEALELERRSAAIMFVDLRDFTSFAETAPARELALVLAEYRQLVSQTIFEHGGTVDKFIGDGVMAVFGQPAPAEDDADRALACAIDLVDALSDWKNHNAQNGYPALEVGIGLHYGTVVGGVLDSGCHSEFTVIGDAVNVAQRLETLAKSLDAPLVVSSALMLGLQKQAPLAYWIPQKSVALPGRRLPIDVWYLRRGAGVTLAEDHGIYETGTTQTALHRSPFQSSPLSPDSGMA